jgi:hypothetical protein
MTTEIDGNFDSTIYDLEREISGLRADLSNLRTSLALKGYDVNGTDFLTSLAAALTTLRDTMSSEKDRLATVAEALAFNP